MACSATFKCIQILQNCLPPAEFKRIMPLPTWMNNKWQLHIVATTKERAEAFYKASDGLRSGVVKQSNFLRRNKDNIGIGTTAAAAKQSTTQTASHNEAGTEAIHATITGTKTAESIKTETNTNASTGSTLTTAAVMTVTGESAATTTQSAVSTMKSKSDYGPAVDPKTGKVNTAALLAQQGFAERDPTMFGSYTPLQSTFTRVKDYSSNKYNTIGIDKIINWDDLDDDLPKEVKVNAMTEALKNKEARENKYKAFEEAEAARIQAELDKLKATKNLAPMRPPSPPKTVEERNDRLISAGISTANLTDLYKKAHGLAPNPVTFADRQKEKKKKAKEA